MKATFHMQHLVLVSRAQVLQVSLASVEEEKEKEETTVRTTHAINE